MEKNIKIIGKARFQNACSCDNRQKGFALIELLVVVAIIAVLVALLLPTFNEVRNITKKTTWQSNLRQLGVGYSYYIDDHHGELPTTPGMTDSPGNPWYAFCNTIGWWVYGNWTYGWVYRLNPYVGNYTLSGLNLRNTIFDCTQTDDTGVYWFAVNQAWSAYRQNPCFGSPWDPKMPTNVNKYEHPSECLVTQDFGKYHQGTGYNQLRMDWHVAWTPEVDFGKYDWGAPLGRGFVR